MKAKLKLIGSSPAWESHINEVWETNISADSRYTTGNVHCFIHNGKEYLFEIKDARIPQTKILLLGWLTGEETAGKVIFEIQ